MSVGWDDDLLATVVRDANLDKSEEVLQLLRELLDLEQQVSHLARPRNILIKINDLLRETLEADE